MLERIWRGLLWVGAGLFLLIGIPSFVAPVWATSEFPWKVGPFLAQTIGGWSLGTAAIAAHAAYFGRPRRVYPLVVYGAAFGIGQLLVVLAFLDRLLSTNLTYPYLLGLVALAVAGIFFAYAWLRESPVSDDSGESAVTWGRALTVLVAGFVALLGVGTLLAGPDGSTARGQVFPEQMGLFSIRAFSAFLFPLALAMLSTLRSRDLAPYISLAWAGLYLIVPITAAALLNPPLFSSDQPGTMGYLIAVLGYRRLRPAAFRSRGGA